jgi:hypothetical protein
MHIIGEYNLDAAGKDGGWAAFRAPLYYSFVFALRPLW